MQTISFTHHRFPPDVIRHAVWLYARFTLSFRDVEDLLAERGLGWCQSNANQSPDLQMMRISRRQLTPFGQRGSAIFFEGFAAVEMTFEIEMIVDRSMN